MLQFKKKKSYYFAGGINYIRIINLHEEERSPAGNWNVTNIFVLNPKPADKAQQGIEIIKLQGKSPAYISCKAAR